MRFIEFSDMDEAFEYMRQQEEKANDNLLPFQRTIGWGDYWIRAYQGIFIFGRILGEKEAHEGELNAGADAEEAAYTMRMLRGAHDRGYRFGWAYSVVEPEGELGSTHVADMIPITKELFELAQSNNWEPIADVLRPIMAHVDALREEHGV